MQAAQSVGWYVCSFFLPPSPTALTSSLTVTTTPSLVSGASARHNPLSSKPT